jgi:nitronate monooxygenase
MSTHTPVCELLGIDHPIIEAPVADDPRLPAAVSNAGALGTVGLGWAEDAGAVVRETAALTDRPFAGNFVLASDQPSRSGTVGGSADRVAVLGRSPQLRRLGA